MQIQLLLNVVNIYLFMQYASCIISYLKAKELKYIGCLLLMSNKHDKMLLFVLNDEPTTLLL